MTDVRDNPHHRKEQVMSGLIPPGAVRTGSRGLIISVIAAAALAALIIGGWQANWWFASHNATRQAHLIQSGVSNQESEEAQLTSGISSVLDITTQMSGASGQQLADLQAQRLGIAKVACQNASQITSIPAQQAGWVRQNCLDGTVNPSSSLNQ
jgi:hypothetical protein